RGRTRVRWGPHELGGRAREVRRRFAREGPPWTRSQRDFETVSLPARDCDLLRGLLVSEGAGTVVEVGLAYGSSALAIGEALVTVGRPRPRHVIVDPYQEGAFHSVGWEAICAAGLQPITRLMPVPSSIALPQLVAENLVADAAFVDGSHRFHEVFVDLYFLRKLVRPGGVVVIDDDRAPSVRTAVRYYERNLGWTAIPDAVTSGTRMPPASPDHDRGRPPHRDRRGGGPAIQRYGGNRSGPPQVHDHRGARPVRQLRSSAGP